MSPIIERRRARSLALHRAVAERLLDHPELLDAARSRVTRWLSDKSVARPYAQGWDDLLREAPEVVARALVDTGETMAALRQVSPFAGALDPRTRWALLARMRQAP